MVIYFILILNFLFIECNLDSVEDDDSNEILSKSVENEYKNLFDIFFLRIKQILNKIYFF